MRNWESTGWVPARPAAFPVHGSRTTHAMGRRALGQTYVSDFRRKPRSRPEMVNCRSRSRRTAVGFAGSEQGNASRCQRTRRLTAARTGCGSSTRRRCTICTHESAFPRDAFREAVANRGSRRVPTTQAGVRQARPRREICTGHAARPLLGARPPGGARRPAWMRDCPPIARARRGVSDHQPTP